MKKAHQTRNAPHDPGTNSRNPAAPTLNPAVPDKVKSASGGADLPNLGLAEMHVLIARNKANELRIAENKKRDELASQARSAKMLAKKEKKEKWLKKMAEKKRLRKERAAATKQKKLSAAPKARQTKLPMIDAVDAVDDEKNVIYNVIKPVRPRTKYATDTKVGSHQWPTTTDRSASPSPVTSI